MTTLTLSSTRPRAGAGSLRRVVASEALKAWTVPSYVLATAAALVLTAAFGPLSALVAGRQAADGVPGPGTVAAGALAGLTGAQIVFALTATVLATSEWAQGTVRPTYLCSPRRWPVLAAKAGLVGGAGLLVGVLGAGVALAGTSALVGTPGAGFAGPTGTAGSTGPTTGGTVLSVGLVARLVAGSGVYLAAVGLLALGLATVIRSTVASLITVLALVTVAPLLLAAVPAEPISHLAAYLPTTAGPAVLQPEGATAHLAPWAGAGIALAWAGAALTLASITIRRTDS